MDRDAYLAILETVPTPIVFVDTSHTIRYLNRAARRRYYEKRGLSSLEGRSIFACHKQASTDQIMQLFARMQAGEDEIFLKVNKDGERVTVVAVRGADGVLLGYYERFDLPSGERV